MSKSRTIAGSSLLAAVCLIAAHVESIQAGEFSVALRPGAVAVERGANGQAEFRVAGAAWLSKTGEPAVPWSLVSVLLPPDARIETVSVEPQGVHYRTVSGTWNVGPMPPPMTWRNGQAQVNWPQDRVLVNGRDVSIYGTNAPWPRPVARLVDAGVMRGWRVARVAVPLALYNPADQTLAALVGGELTLRYESDAARAVVGGADDIAAGVLRTLCINYAQQAPAYEPAAGGRSAPGYAIITTSDVALASVQLPAFVAHQEARGFSVQVITEEDFGGGLGDTAAENIRGWLQAHYLADNIQYVLLIGDPRPGSRLPMKVLYPLRDGQGQPLPYPSDFYYSDLTGNWDLDGDGRAGEGEPPEDFGPGGIDVQWDVVVGRIPYYGSIVDLNVILAKTIAYQNQTGAEPAWRRRVLLPMKPLNDDTPSYQVGELIKRDALEPESWIWERVYDEDYGVVPPPEMTPCTIEGVTSIWSMVGYGLVVWCTHGCSYLACDVMDIWHVPELNDYYPAFTFQGSCANADPQDVNNLTYSLLRHGGICTIGATSTAYYYLGETYYLGSASVGGLGYAYAGRIVGGQTSGLALQNMKQALWNENMWPNYVAFCLYGDPSTALVPAATGDIHNVTRDTWHASIQDAVELAGDGDEIVLAPGTYTGRGNHDIALGGKTLVIRSSDPHDPAAVAATVIDCQGTGENPRRAFVIQGEEGPETVIAGLTIRGGNAAEGAAVRCGRGSSPTIRDCVFTGNSCAWDGGAILNYGGCMTRVLRCRFVGNGAGFGGAISNDEGSDATIAECTFENNSVWGNGGAVQCYRSSPTIVDCTFTGNYANDSGGAIWNNDQAAPLVSRCSLCDNTANRFGGAVAADDHSDPRILECTLQNNHALHGGGMFFGAGSAPLVSNCSILANVASGNGGGMDINNSAPEVRNCWFGGNSAMAGGAGGAIFMGTGCDVTLAGLTLVGNYAVTGGGLYFDDGTLRLRNVIIWDNSDDGGTGESSQLGYYGGDLSIDYSCVQGWTGLYGGAGNSGLDPQFVDPDGPDNALSTWHDNDYRLQAASPEIDAGDPAFAAAPGENDLDGKLRVWDGDQDGAARVDMGAYEQGAAARGDLNCDGALNAFDIDPFVLALTDADAYGAQLPGCNYMLADVNGDGAVNAFDIDGFVGLLTGTR